MFTSQSHVGSSFFFPGVYSQAYSDSLSSSSIFSHFQSASLNKLVVPVPQIQDRILEIVEDHPTGPGFSGIVARRLQTVDIAEQFHRHREHAPIDVVGKVPVRSCREYHQKTAEHNFLDRQ